MDRFSARDMGFSLSQVSSGDCAAAAARAAAANLIFKIGYENVTVNHSHGASRTYMLQRLDERCNADQSEFVALMEGGSFRCVSAHPHSPVRLTVLAFCPCTD